MISGQAMSQDVAAGEKVFNRCKACHSATDETNKVGPTLKGVVGRPAASITTYKYSPEMTVMGKNGLVWTEAELTTYLKDPKAMVKGTKMTFPGLKKDDEIANVIAYLKQDTN